MKKLLGLVSLAMVMSIATLAQDEGAVVVKERFERDKGVYFSLGPAITLGKNLGDYSTGFSFEAGFLKRSNKVLSWGPNVSFLNFAYDESATYPYYYDPINDFALEVYLEGGNVKIISAGMNFKINFIPVSDNTVFSAYGIANPFISYVIRDEVLASADIFEDTDLDGLYYEYSGSVTYEAADYPALADDSKFSGGVHLGFGVELKPAKAVSVFAQATFSYTLPISYVATESFLNEEDQYVDANGLIYYDAGNSFYLEEFPIVEKGFSALSIKLGVSFNF